MCSMCGIVANTGLVHRAVFHAGPSREMNWIFTNGNGRTEFAGFRPSDDAANGNAVMYDARNGHILTVGGSSAFAQPEFPGRGDTVIITLQATSVHAATRVVGSLNTPRVYGNVCVLPDGKVALVGGAEVPKEFSDDYPVFDTGVHLACSRQFPCGRDRCVRCVYLAVSAAPGGAPCGADQMPSLQRLAGLASDTS